MEDGWRWRKPRYREKINLKKEVKNYELWRIWWTICTTMFKRKIK